MTTRLLLDDHPAELLRLRQLWSRPDGWRDRLARAIAPKEVMIVPSGRVVVRSGARQESLYLVLDGCARATLADGTRTAVRPGDLIDGGVLSDRPSGATVVAHTPMRLLPIAISVFDDLGRSDPSLIIAMLDHQRGWWSSAEHSTPRPQLDAAG